jgi:hypothetical protein
MLLSIYCTITSNKDLTEIPTSSIFTRNYVIEATLRDM